jgi:type IV secretion system protein VirB2
MSASLSDPSGSSAVHAALEWMQATFLGSAAQAVAVICVASVGFMMLSGRIDLRRSGSIILGCFLLFEAPTIALALRSLADATVGEADNYPQVATQIPASSPPVPPKVSGYDPYAGASVRR